MKAIEATGRIRIVKTPQGEAPEWVRREWVGLELPSMPYLSLPDGSEKGVFTGRPVKVEFLGINVPEKEAIEALVRKSPAAAVWWVEHGYPKQPYEDNYFEFNRSEFEIISGVDTKIKPVQVADDMETGFFEVPGGR